MRCCCAIAIILRGEDDKQLAMWLAKKTDKYTPGDIQNEILEAMALNIMRKVI